MKPEICMLVGLPASGKTKYAEEIRDKYGYEVYSSDAIRKNIYGDENIQGDPNEVFGLMQDLTVEALLRGDSVVYDATNVSSKRRRAFISNISRIPCHKSAIVFATPFKQCRMNNSTRERNIQLSVSWKMYASFQMPCWFEGWDSIRIVYPDNGVGKCDLASRYDFMDKYDQGNPHHTLTLGAHMRSCAEIIKNLYPDRKDLYVAGLLHDIGKPYCRSNKNMRGEVTDIAHYYEHDRISAYESLFYMNDDNHSLMKSLSEHDRVYIAALITWHMQPYFWKQDKTVAKYKRIFGDTFFNDLMILHDADVNAH